MLVVITAVASALLDNVTTVLLIAPVTLLVCDRLGASPVPFLIAEVMASNIGGTATLIGDPPNIIIASRAGLTFNDFLVHLAPIVVVLLVVFLGLCRVLFRERSHYDAAAGRAGHGAGRARGDPRPRRCCPVARRAGAWCSSGFVLHSALHLEPSIVALLGAGLLVAVSRLEPDEYPRRRSSGRPCVFFAGLFIMVGAPRRDSASSTPSARRCVDAVGDQLPPGGRRRCCWGSAVLSGDRRQHPLRRDRWPRSSSDLVQAGGGAAASHALWWALALGADLGGNATAIGASANVVVLGIADRNGHPISFWQFTKYGLVVTAVTVALCLGLPVAALLPLTHHLLRTQHQRVAVTLSQPGPDVGGLAARGVAGGVAGELLATAFGLPRARRRPRPRPRPSPRPSRARPRPGRATGRAESTPRSRVSMDIRVRRASRSSRWRAASWVAP